VRNYYDYLLGAHRELPGSSSQFALCIDTLFDKDTTENWGHLGQTELGTKSHLQKKSNFALPLVILTWQRMLLEHFHDNSGETFFELGNYSARPTKYAAAPLDNLYLIRRDRIKEGQDTQFFSIDCFKIKEELSILQWEDYILQQDANLETTNEKRARLKTFEIRPMKTYKMATNAIKWRITDEKDTDDTHQQVTSPSKGNEENYDCSKDKSLTLLKNMAEAMDVSKRYYEQLKQKTNDKKQEENKVNIGCASLVQCMKNKLKADAQLGWNATLEWISDQAKLETFECKNYIDNDNTSKQNNHMGDNNEGGNQNASEKEDGGKRVDESSSSDDDEDKNQYEDDKDKANKEKITTSFWENNSDEENEWNEEGSTDGDINRDDKTQDESEKNMPVTM
jgi:hypothetical protein